MQGTALERIVHRNRDVMHREPVVSQPDMTALLTHLNVTEPFQCADHAILQTHHVAASCSFDRNQFILYKMQLQQPWVHRAVLEMKRRRFNHTFERSSSQVPPSVKML